MKKETSTVSFRLDSHYIGKLQRQAEKHGISIHEQARRMVIDDLDDGERDRLREEVKEVKGTVSNLRGDLGAFLLAVLVEVANIDENEVRKYVTENLGMR